MKDAEAVELIRDAVSGAGVTWADLGAGDGVFTRALAELLGPAARIYAVDRDKRALASLNRRAASSVTTVTADFTKPFDLPGLGPPGLDGVLLANALHYVRDDAGMLTRVAAMLRSGGRVVLIEYDRCGANPWVPYPILKARLPELAAAAGLTPPVFTATRPSSFGGDLYVATMDRP
jgi:ubiquinone/menaquinone biosynthesis C-methylase UbiE